MKNLLPYIYDFLEMVFDSHESRRYIRNAILFGSVATGEYDKESDIDLFIDVTSEDAIDRVEKIMKEAEKRFYSVAEKKWSLLGIEVPIKYIVGCLETYRWKEIKSEIISSGLNLYGKYVGIKDDLRHFSLFSFDLSELDNRKKVMFHRKLFGYSQKRKGKKYSTTGFMKDLGGIRLGRGAILCPIEKSHDMQRFFISFKVRTEIREAWIRG